MVDGANITDGATLAFSGLLGRGGPLTVTLVWYDYPAFAQSKKALVNDLDLAVVVEGVAVLGNGGRTPDRINSVERVSRTHACMHARMLALACVLGASVLRAVLLCGLGGGRGGAHVTPALPCPARRSHMDGWILARVRSAVP